jgi:hypothetical protein
MSIGHDMYEQNLLEKHLTSGEWNESRETAIATENMAINDMPCCDCPTQGLAIMVQNNRIRGKRLLRFCNITSSIPWYVVKKFAPILMKF